MHIPTESDLVAAIADATRLAVTSLFSAHPEHYYYVTLITTGEALSPTLSAWSTEALSASAAANDAASRAALRWSYADSPYFAYGEQFFEHVKVLFGCRPGLTVGMSGPQWKAEYDLRLRAMEAAMSTLDRAGLFGSGPSRNAIVTLVEVVPPDYTNTARAIRLNPPEALRAWLAEAAEPLP
jgi:hypothetical protein